MELELKPLALPGVPMERPIVIAGPCSAETEEQVINTARSLADRGTKIFRAGIWKPRTKPGGFEGIGVDGLPWLKQVKEETGIPDMKVVATGGLGRVISDETDSIDIYDSALTLEGLRIIYAKNKK